MLFIDDFGESYRPIFAIYCVRFGSKSGNMPTTCVITVTCVLHAQNEFEKPATHRVRNQLPFVFFVSNAKLARTLCITAHSRANVEPLSFRYILVGMWLIHPELARIAQPSANAVGRSVAQFEWRVYWFTHMICIRRRQSRQKTTPVLCHLRRSSPPDRQRAFQMPSSSSTATSPSTKLVINTSKVNNKQHVNMLVLHVVGGLIIRRAMSRHSSTIVSVASTCHGLVIWPGLIGRRRRCRCRRRCCCCSVVEHSRGPSLYRLQPHC